MAGEELHKIRKLRESKDFSQEYMADQLGMSQGNYAKIESGKIKLGTVRLKKIAAILEKSTQYFMSEEPLADPYGKGPDWNIEGVAEDIYKRSRFAGFKIQEKALLRKEPNTLVEIIEVAYSDQLANFIYKVATDKLKVVRYVPEYLLKKK
jgi:transcriptional regulator with XRE-family HTH domain